MKFEKQEKDGVNSHGHYQFGSNCCIGCKRERSLNEPGEWCDVCINYQTNQPKVIKDFSVKNVL